MKTSAETLPTSAARVGRARAYLELTKPRLNSLVLATTAVGFYWASRGTFHGLSLAHALIGTALVAGGASALNQYIEREGEALMRRTADRPLPSGRLQPREALVFGALIALIGLAYLAVTTNALTMLLSAVTIGSYLFIYTPLKKKTWLCTIVGAVPGAIPPMLGWTAARDQLGVEAWVLFAILFFWQLPHFFAIAWLYRDDYVRAGYPMLTTLDPDGRATSRHIIGWTLALIATSAAPFFLKLAGALFLSGALALGLAFLGFGIGLARGKTDVHARRLFFASIVYLPLLLILLLASRIGS